MDLISRIQKRELDAAVILLPEGYNLPSGITGEMLRTDTIAVAVPKGFRFPPVVGWRNRLSNLGS